MNFEFSMNRGIQFIGLISLFIFIGCESKKSELAWDKSFYQIGSQSSPRVADLNGDGILDVVIGAGKNEFQYSKQGVLAINGSTGDLLWDQETSDQVFGSATFNDINQDNIPDVIIGGRSPNLRALNGKNGDVIWGYDYHYEKDSILKYARFNFYNTVVIPDQNDDAISELLVVNGGNSKARANSHENRYPGVLMIMDGKTGAVMAADTMPDGGESYMSPVCFKQPGSSEYNIVFGTGGETLDGSLYIATLSELKKNKLSSASKIATDAGHGFIAPPTIADVNEDGWFDIMAISHGSKIVAIDGKDKELIWERKIEGTESSNSIAVGYFTNDKIPDFFTFVSDGIWPDNTGSKQVLLDGKNGAIIYSDSIGCTGFSSPVVYDLNHDGIDEAIISINDFDCSQGFVNQKKTDVVNRLLAIDFKNKRTITLDESIGFKNIFSTPYIGDLDKDGYLDIVNCIYYNASSDPLFFLGMRVRRISTNIEMKEPVKWGSYMGSNGNGVFTSKQQR